MCEARNDLDHLLIDLESNDSNSVASVLRAIYDSDESEKFMSKLETRILHHDQEIERMCSAHYKSFIDCIQELLPIRPNAEGLKRETMEINAELMKSTDIIQRKAEELIKARRILVNSSSSIELLKKCLFVLEQYSRFNDQLQEKKYFPALKTLESLERDHLPTVSDFKFAQNICEEIPKFRLVIKEASTKDLNDFLEGLLIKSQKIGEIVLRSAVKQQNFDDYEQLFDRESQTNDTTPSINKNTAIDNDTATIDEGLHNLSLSYSSKSSTPNSRISQTSTTVTKPASSKKRRAPQPPGMGSSENRTQNNSKSLQNSRRDSAKNGSGELSALSLVDFCPVYRGLHIFSNLGFREQFDNYYREQRQKQSRLAFSPPTNMSRSITAYHDYFSSVVGFFVIEDHLMGTTKDFIQYDYLNELWQNAVQSMTVSLRHHAKLCQDAYLMLKIKKLMMLFTFTIRNYGHNTDALAEILITIREQYNEILMNQWREKFEEIFKQDSYHPLEVQNNEEYLQAVGALSFFETDSVHFPKKFPFSLFVPKVYEEVRSFIEQSLKFSQDLNSSQSDVENMVRKSTNQLLTQTLGSCLTALINDSSLKLLQLIQITINTNYLEDAMQFLDDHITYQISKSMSGLSSCYSMSSEDNPEPMNDPNYLHGDRNRNGSTNHQFAFKSNHVPSRNQSNQMITLVDNNSNALNNTQVKLQGKSMFKDARAEAESQIYRKLNDQIDEFLSLADYDWTLSEPNGQASSFISDLIAWLKSTFQAFTNLPQRVAQGACMSACKHIAQSLRDILLSDDVKSLSIGGLEQFNLDLIQCEVFAGSEPVRGFKEGDLQMAFAELRQLCDLFIYEDYSTYMSDMGKQQNKYLRVTTATALILVDKLREFDRKKTVFALKKNDKQKLRDTFAKNLRQVQQQQTLQNQQYQQQS